MNYAQLTPPKVLILRYFLESQLAAAASITGRQAERAELGLTGPPPDGGRVNVQEVLRARLADFTILCRDLSELEQAICRARYGSYGGTEGYRVVKRLCDVPDLLIPPDGNARRRGDGEELSDLRPTDPEGKPLAGWVEVSGVRARLPSYTEIGDLLGFTPGQVRGILQSAREKILTAIQWRWFAQMTKITEDE